MKPFKAGTCSTNFLPFSTFDTFDTPFDTMIQFYGTIYNENEEQQERNEIEEDVTESDENDENNSEITIAETNNETPILHEDPRVETEDQEEIEREEKEGRPARLKSAPIHLKDYVTQPIDTCCTTTSTPKTYKQAVNSTEANEWIEAMESEMDSLKNNEVYEIVKLPEDKRVIGSRWVYTLKDNPDGELRYKARFVAKGYTKVEGED